MFKLVTFNIRCDFDQDGENSFRYRKALILEKLANEKPDIICFQEVLPHVAVWLKENLKDYYVVGCGRSETLEDEQMAVAYRRDRWNLISMETFWLSPTPRVPGSRYESQSVCPRTCTEVFLEDQTEKQILHLLDLHLDYEGSLARSEALKQVMQKLKDNKFFTDASVIVTGDFNAEPDSEELSLMKEYPEFENLTEGIGITYHGFLPEDEKCSIDYIFHRKAASPKYISCKKVEKWQEKNGNVWLSDHFPICASLEWAD